MRLAYLSLVGKPEKTRFASVRRLYVLRSKAVHGEDILEDDLKSATRESFSLLQELISSNHREGAHPWTR